MMCAERQSIDWIGVSVAHGGGLGGAGGGSRAGCYVLCSNVLWKSFRDSGSSF